MQKYLKEYCDRHPVILVVIACVFVWGFLGFVNRDSEITELESALTNTTDGDSFEVSCEDYFVEENLEVLNQEQKSKICRDLGHIVDEVNREIIEGFHTRPSEGEGGVCNGRYDTDC
jgi:hypothetical protein